MEEILVAKPVIAEIVSVVRGQDDHRVLNAALGLQVVQQPPELIVALPDQAHVGGDHFRPDFRPAGTPRRASSR